MIRGKHDICVCLSDSVFRDPCGEHNKRAQLRRGDLKVVSFKCVFQLSACYKERCYIDKSIRKPMLIDTFFAAFCTSRNALCNAAGTDLGCLNV